LERETQAEKKATQAGGYWAEIQLDRPQRRNALTGGMMASLGACVYTLATTSASENKRNGGRMEGIVLRGSGGFFCSGSDLTLLTMSSMDDADTMVNYMQVRVKSHNRHNRA
jgi:enoyl-CoA hydratase/carnithine racemase